MKTQTCNAHIESRPGVMVSCLVSTGRLSLCAEGGSVMEEKWRLIPEFPDYAVSSKGRVKRASGGNNSTYPGRILKPQTNKQGYLRCWIIRNGKGYSRLIHRIVLSAFVGPCPFGCECNHKDGIKKHNWAENLEWVSRHINMRHALAHGLTRNDYGEKARNHKLKESEVISIKKLLASGGLSLCRIGEMFNVHNTTISAIKTGRNWSKITLQEEVL